MRHDLIERLRADATLFAPAQWPGPLLREAADALEEQQRDLAECRDLLKDADCACENSESWFARRQVQYDKMTDPRP